MDLHAPSKEEMEHFTGLFKEQITEGLDGILADVEAGKLEITAEYEDIHSFVEANLIDRIGDAGKKLHTGRSRNDQVALDMKLYVRDEIDETDKELKDLLLALQKIMEENVHTYMPGFTHLQKAQPVTLAHHVGAYFDLLLFFLCQDPLFCKHGNMCLASTDILSVKFLIKGNGCVKIVNQLVRFFCKTASP